MSSSEKEQKKQTDLSWIFLVLLVVGLFLILNVDKKSAEPTKTNTATQTMTDKEKISRVNEHMQETALKVAQDRVRRAAEAQKELDRLKNTGTQQKYDGSQGLTFDTDASMQNLTQELNRSHDLSDDQLTPEQIVNNRLLEMQLEEKADQAEREEYARRFIENARAGGWDIRLGPNFEVLSVKKIRKRTPTLFEAAPSDE